MRDLFDVYSSTNVFEMRAPLDTIRRVYGLHPDAGHRIIRETHENNLEGCALFRTSGDKSVKFVTVFRAEAPLGMEIR